MSDYVTCTGVKCHTRDGNCWEMHMTSWSKAQVCRRTQLPVFWDLAFGLTLTWRLFVPQYLSQSSRCLHNKTSGDICLYFRKRPVWLPSRFFLCCIIQRTKHSLDHNKTLSWKLEWCKLERFVGRLMDETNCNSHWVKWVLLFLTDSLAAPGKRDEVFI
jgi:hypothetical protein